MHEDTTVCNGISILKLRTHILKRFLASATDSEIDAAAAILLGQDWELARIADDTHRAEIERKYGHVYEVED